MKTITLLSSLFLLGCATTADVRITNRSEHDFTNVSVMNTQFGNIASGATTDYLPVKLRARYASMEMKIGDQRITAQMLNFGGNRFTYDIEVADLEKGHLAIEIEAD